jgi:hypothetical protein
MTPLPNLDYFLDTALARTLIVPKTGGADHCSLVGLRFIPPEGAASGANPYPAPLGEALL